MPKFYQDDPKYYAKVELNGREIRLRETPEASAFFQSLIDLTDARQLVGAAIWLCQQSIACCHGNLSLTPLPTSMTVQGIHIAPFITPEGKRFFESIESVTDLEKREAMGIFLNEVGKQLLARSMEADPGMYTGYVAKFNGAIENTEEEAE